MALAYESSLNKRFLLITFNYLERQLDSLNKASYDLRFRVEREAFPCYIETCWGRSFPMKWKRWKKPW